MADRNHCVRCGGHYSSWRHFDVCGSNACAFFARWHNVTCAEAWPASRFAWCEACKQ